MPFIPAPNCAKIEMIFGNNGQTSVNVFHVQQETPYDQTSLAVVATLFIDWWDTNLKGTTDNTVGLVKVIASALDTDSSPSIEVTSGLPIVGTSTSFNQLPNNCTVAVKWSTALRGRSYRGRTYHIGLCEEQVVGNTVDPTSLATLTAAYNALLDDLDGLPANLVVVSKFHNNLPRTTAVVTPIQACSIDSTIDSQRRRLPGRGA